MNEEVKRDLSGWRLGRVVIVVDRGFSSEENLRTLQRSWGHYIVGERLRSGAQDTNDALSRPGRFNTVRDNLEVKEIVVGDGERRQRFVLVRNPREAERDSRDRESTLAQVKAELRRIGDLKGAPHSTACVLWSPTRCWAAMYVRTATASPG
ncbi:MAG: hypothetical protein RDU89_00710 [bacterium]|nr:hypothetical protein [bacterium]